MREYREHFADADAFGGEPLSGRSRRAWRTSTSCAITRQRPLGNRAVLAAQPEPTINDAVLVASWAALLITRIENRTGEPPERTSVRCVTIPR